MCFVAAETSGCSGGELIPAATDSKNKPNTINKRDGAYVRSRIFTAARFVLRGRIASQTEANKLCATTGQLRISIQIILCAEQRGHARMNKRKHSDSVETHKLQLQ